MQGISVNRNLRKLTSKQKIARLDDRPSIGCRYQQIFQPLPLPIMIYANLRFADHLRLTVAVQWRLNEKASATTDLGR